MGQLLSTGENLNQCHQKEQANMNLKLGTQAAKPEVIVQKGSEAMVCGMTVP